MDQQQIQRTRYLLQSRFRRIRTAKSGHFELVCQQVLVWLENHPILSSIIHHLDNVSGDHHHELQLLHDTQNLNGTRYYNLSVKGTGKQEHEPDFSGYTPKTLEQHASACLQVIRYAIRRPTHDFYCLLCVFLTQEIHDPTRGTSLDDAVQLIQDIAARDLYEYLDERLDSINAVNGILRKYKQDVEWFQRNLLRQVAAGHDSKSGERALAVHLQRYVFNQGVEFTVEPASVSGEVDLILRDASGQYTIIDAKYVSQGMEPSVIVRKIAEGFNQVARYCDDYNQPEGFLAVFVDDDISILLDIESSYSFKYFTVGGNVIYYVEINIAERPSASKSGKAKQIHIPSSQLTELIEEESV